ncbi:acyl-[acyl-carrier-protein] thioesterase [Finegoldia magna]|uniref:acyl-[acyl-carrier-protein] thioesterase n=1 Tax=Finegoldia magna TaxID=1260 RepID=UPI00370D5F5A
MNVPLNKEEILKEELKDLNGSWIIYQWDVDIHDMPERFDDLTIQTYHTYTRKFYAFRNYDVFKNGELIVRAKTKWLLVNPEKKLPIRISDTLVEIYGREDGYEIIEKDVEMLDGDYKKCGEYIVRKTDIDYNYHANNARYIEWIENYLDDDTIKKVEVVYKKELKLGESVEIYRLVEDSVICFKLITDGVLKTIIKITK